MAEGPMPQAYAENGAPRIADDVRGGNRRLFMRLFVAQDGMMFLALFAAYISLRIGAGDRWRETSEQPGLPLAAGMTLALLLGSCAMLGAVAATRRGDRRGARIGIVGGIVGGLLFVAGETVEYLHLIGNGGMRPDRSLFDATFFMLTGFHGAHVLAGVIYLAAIAVRQGSGAQTREAAVEAAALYWHFIDAIWLLLFLMIYVI